MEEKDESVNEYVNDKGVCRTAPAIPGLKNTKRLTQEKRYMTVNNVQNSFVR